MPQIFFDWSTWVFGLIGAAGVVIGWRGLAGSGTNQTMTNSEHSTQEATRPGVKQTMDKSKQGKQKA